MKKIIDSLKSATNVALLPHINPDWDAIGSCFALFEALKDLGKNCVVLTDEALDYRFSFADIKETVYDEKAEYDFDLVCAIDCATSSRLGRRMDFFLKEKNTILIDHHASNENYASYSLVEGEKCATAEIIYDIIEGLGASITKKIADYLFCGISTDSGSFQYNSVTDNTFLIAGKLRSVGADVPKLSVELYQNNPYKKLLLKARIIESMEFFCENKFSIAVLTLDDFKECEADISLSEDLADVPRAVLGVEISVLLREVKQNEIRMSFRSKNTDITPVAKYFGGGGHERASGATYHGGIDDAKKILKREIEKILR